MAFFDQYASRLNEAAISHLSDGLCTVHPSEGADVADVPYQYDNAFEMFDEQGLSMYVKTLLLPVEFVGSLEMDLRASFTVGGQLWRFGSVVEDDGHFVRYQVTT